jgi:hypothetical protein
MYLRVGEEAADLIAAVGQAFELESDGIFHVAEGTQDPLAATVPKGDCPLRGRVRPILMFRVIESV